MNVDLDVSVKFRVSEETPEVEPRRPILAALMDRIASQPCVVMILREIMRNSYPRRPPQGCGGPFLP